MLLNYKYFILAFLVIAFFFETKAQNSSYELNGEKIYYDKCDDQEFPVKNAFDNNNGTYFRSCPPFGNWIGMDLGEKHIITKIAYCPRIDSDYRDRLQLGVFEGANQPDFGDAIALFIIPGYTDRKLNEQEINCTRGFRYVRFVFPYAQTDWKSSYMGELKFYGYKGAGNDSKLPQLTNLPTVSIHTVDAQDITSKEEYVKGIISVVYENGTRIYTDSLEIRGRGNNSWGHPKKPYRIKLAESTRLMNLPAKARNWTLINNYGDKTLMRNILSFDFSRRVEMPYTSPAVAVDVVLNGDYKGSYQLCDHIDVRKNRINIEEMKATDLTGGYLIEIDAYAGGEPKHFNSNQYDIPVSIKYPDEDEIVLAQENYIKKHFNKWTNAVSSSNYEDAETGFRKYMDVESFLRYFLVEEYSGNTDAYWSIRLAKYKDDDKFYFGPAWDFDLAFENDWRTYPINTRAWDTGEWVCFSDASSAAGGMKELVKRIFSDEEIEKKLEKIYSHYRDKNIISKEKLVAVVDSCAELLSQSQDLNFKRWQILNTQVHENPVIYGSYDGEVDNVRNYVAERIEWLDSKLNYVPGLTPSAFGQAPSNVKIWTENNTIHLSGLSAGFLLRVVDVSGHLVSETEINSNNFSLYLNSGLYLIVLIDSHQTQFTWKCVIP